MDFKIIKEILPYSSDDAFLKLEAFYHLLVSENQKYNLTSLISEEEVLIKHFYDSLFPFKDLDLTGKKVLDIGSGAGFPIVPLCLLNNRMLGYAIDSNNKKIFFLNKVKNELGMDNLHIINGRAEILAHKTFRDSFDIVTARAFAPSTIELEILAPFVKVGGVLIALKSKHYLEEKEDILRVAKKLNLTLVNTSNFILPNNMGERYVLTFKKHRENSKIYPRDYSLIKNKPL